MKPGERVGRFEIVGLLGQGAMGSVYRARDPELGQETALPLLDGEHRLDALESRAPRPAPLATR